MRRVLAVALALLLTAACGGTKPTNFSDVLAQTAAKTTTSGSSRMSMVTETVADGHHVTIRSDGVVRFADNVAKSSMVLDIPGAPGPISITEIITGGYLYMAVPGQPGYYGLKLSDLVGTQFAQNSDPAGQLTVLLGVSGPVKKLGTEVVRGAKTTHVTGTIDLSKAAARVQGAMKAIMQKALAQAKSPSIPFDAYVDDQGRLRKIVQHLTLTVKGQDVTSTSTLEYYDFGTPVSVTAPPAGDVHDGSAILKALKAQSG